MLFYPQYTSLSTSNYSSFPLLHVLIAPVIAEKNESREAVPRTGVEANTVVKDAGKAERKAITEKKTMIGKEKKLSIHEHLKKYVQLWA